MLDRAIDLYQQGNSSREAAKKAGISKDRLLYAMKARGIPRRTQSQAWELRIKHLEVSERFIEIVDGLLLGDGYLNNGRHSSGFRLTLKSKDFINWIQELLESCGISCRRSMQDIYHRLETLSYAELLDQRRRWYQLKKEVPFDVRITPLSTKLWFLGDGHLRKALYKPTGVITYNVGLYTCQFKRNDLLVDLLASNGIESHVGTTAGKYPYIVIGSKNVKPFFDFMGACPADDMQYKWPGTFERPLLTRKQQAVVRLMRRGYSPAEIAVKFQTTRVAVYSLIKYASDALGDDPLFEKGANGRYLYARRKRP